MGISSIANTAYAFKIVKMLTTSWDKFPAFKSGVVDKNGKLLVPLSKQTPAQKKTYTLFDRLVFNIKRTIDKVPGGKLTSYAAALFLLKEYTELTDDELFDIIHESYGFKPEHFLNESTWIQKDDMLVAGEYRLNESVPVTSTLEPVAIKGSIVSLDESADPIGYVQDIPLYKMYHADTRSHVIVTALDISR